MWLFLQQVHCRQQKLVHIMYINQAFLVGADALGDVGGLLQFLVDVEDAGERDFVADLGLVDPGVGGVGEHLAGEVVVDVLLGRRCP